MSTSQVDEETPLLTVRTKTPLPMGQLSIILFLQLAEPLTSQVIYPFAPQLIRDIGVTHGDETRVGYYVGILQSLFFLTQAMTVLHWSRLSDRIGRKPVIMCGLLGLSVSMYCFGLSITFLGLLLSRGFCGMLNGNIGIIKSMIAEITDSTNIAQAYGSMPIAWSTGTTLGPMIGGFLLKPAERFPAVFGRSEFFKKYPYFLPCSVPATFSIVAWIVTYFYLKETVKSPIPIAEVLGFKSRNTKPKSHDHQHHESNDPPADDMTVNSSSSKNLEKPLPLRAVLIPRVILAAANYATLSLVDIAYRAIQPLFMSTPIELGGLGMPPPEIGKYMSLYGVLNGAVQLFIFPRLQERWGSKNVFLFALTASIPMIVFYPILNLLARSLGVNHVVVAMIVLQTVLSAVMSMAFGAIFIHIAASSPNRASIGTTNGIAQMTVSVVRAVGPAAANSLFSLSIEKQYLDGHLVYWVMLGTCLFSIGLGCMLPSKLK